MRQFGIGQIQLGAHGGIDLPSHRDRTDLNLWDSQPGNVCHVSIEVLLLGLRVGLACDYAVEIEQQFPDAGPG